MLSGSANPHAITACDVRGATASPDPHHHVHHAAPSALSTKHVRPPSLPPPSTGEVRTGATVEVLRTKPTTGFASNTAEIGDLDAFKRLYHAFWA